MHNPDRNGRTGLRDVLVVLEMDTEKRSYDTSHSIQAHAFGDRRDELPVIGESLFFGQLDHSMQCLTPCPEGLTLS
jgi:hypothetical protein